MNPYLKQLGGVLLKGLVAILPIGLTVYVVYWLGVTTESLLSGPLQWLLPPGIYKPGLGLVAGFLLLFVVGLLVNAYVVRRVLGAPSAAGHQCPSSLLVCACFRWFDCASTVFDCVLQPATGGAP